MSNLIYTAKRFSRNFGVHVHAYVNGDMQGMLTERDIAGIRHAADGEADVIHEREKPRKHWEDYYAAALLEKMLKSKQIEDGAGK